MDKTSRDQPRWRCGSSDVGRSCQRGPNSSGQCRGGSACEPRRESDRWYCTRSEFDGGACEEGPSPTGRCAHKVGLCQPVPTVYSRRRSVILVLLLLSLLFILWVLTAHQWPSILEPGPRASVHSSIERCSLCHAAADGQPLPAMLTHIVMNSQELNTDRCLTCHQMGNDARHPHSMNQLALAMLTKTVNGQQSNDISMPMLQNRSLTCEQCHQEHRGRMSELKLLDDDQCQSCHSKPFKQFENSHPEFKNFPHTSMKVMAFSHGEHYNKHFSNEKYRSAAPENCQTCHKLNKTESHWTLTGFEGACATCHNQDVTAKNQIGDKGILYWTIPGVDIQHLKQKGYNIGEWPESAEGSLTPFMKQWFKDDVKTSKSLEEINELDWTDLSTASEEQLQKLVHILWKIKKALHDFSVEGPPVVKEHQQAITVAEFPPEDLVDSFMNQAFPHLSKELEQLQHGSQVKTVGIALREQRSQQKTLQQSDWAHHGGWYREGSELYYRPRHHADLFLQKSIEEAKRDKDDVLLTTLLATDAPGQCGKCHQDDTHLSSFHWRQTLPDNTKTHFSHKPHLELMGEKQCESCHRFEKQGVVDKDFIDMTLGDCARCHNKKQAPTRCLTCHKYHFTPEHPQR